MRQRSTVTSRWPVWSAVLALLVAACSSSAGSAEIPDGYQAYEDDEHVTFAVPEHFERTSSGDELIDGLEVEFLDDPSGEQPLPEQITLRYAFPDSPSFDIGTWATVAFPPVMGDDEKVSEEPDEVEGAEQAMRVEFVRHHDPVDEPVREVAVGAMLEGEDGPLIADLRYIAVESEFDEAIADALLDSLRVR